MNFIIFYVVCLFSLCIDSVYLFVYSVCLFYLYVCSIFDLFIQFVYLFCLYILLVYWLCLLLCCFAAACCACVQSRGAVFVEDISLIPMNSVVIFSAHGVSPSIREIARKRNLITIDATCPLVQKVHVYVQQKAREGFNIIIIGHKNHGNSFVISFYSSLSSLSLSFSAFLLLYTCILEVYVHRNSTHILDVNTSINLFFLLLKILLLFFLVLF